MRTPHRSILSKAAKRVFDVTLASLGLGATALPLTLVAAAIRLETPGPVFYRGERVGLGGKTFRIFKLRSMRVTDRTGPTSTSDEDERITKVGKFIRRLKLDELPQLLNVVAGDMSLVGPRPEVKRYVDLYTEEEQAILSVRPGITDWASMKFHNEGEIINASGIADPDEAYLKLIRPEKLRLQLEYVRRQSLATDLRILIETVGRLLGTRLLENAETIRRGNPSTREAAPDLASPRLQN